jgi:hypothetical protein
MVNSCRERGGSLAATAGRRSRLFHNPASLALMHVSQTAHRALRGASSTGRRGAPERIASHALVVFEDFPHRSA